MSQPVRHIVFDIGRVLIHYDPDLAYHTQIPDPAERAWFLANVCTNEWNIEQDRGRTWADAEALLVAAHPAHEANIRLFRTEWHKMVPHAYEENVAVMEGLIERGWDVTLLTNFAADTFLEARDRFPFLAKPRGVTVSGEIGLIKPDPEIYRVHSENFGLNPAATLFIDDSPANVEGAKRAGWDAVLVTDNERLRADLKERGVDV